MFAQIIELKNKENTAVDVENIIACYIVSLRNNGQILLEWSLVKVDGGYNIYVSTPKEDSLSGLHDSIYVKKYRQELDQYFDIYVKKIGLNAYSREYCSCTHRTAMEMQTYFEDIDSVFTCCACGKPVALYELPYLDKQDDHYAVVNWQGIFCATDKLWLDSLSDRFTGNQLVNVNSELSKRGREIADEIGKKAGLKVYYNVFDDFTKKVKFVKVNDRKVRLCPGCGKPMQYAKFCDNYKEIFVCEDCLLSSDLPNE